MHERHCPAGTIGALVVGDGCAERDDGQPLRAILHEPSAGDRVGERIGRGLLRRFARWPIGGDGGQRGSVAER